MVDWEDVVADAVALRRELHRHPELTWQEAGTARTIRQQLDDLGIAWRSCAEHGTVATLAPDAPGRHVALRADIDAMPITEATSAEWSSVQDGRMHACGHDGHTATLMAAARWCKQHEDALPGPVTLLFQPAEEGGHGAKRMIEDGALDGVDVIFGWHNWPGIPFGQAVCPDGPVMAANGTFHIAITGEGGHASQPDNTRDPVLAAANVVTALQQIVARRLPPHQPAVVAVTSIDARSAETVTPDRALVEGSVRLASTEQRTQVAGLITEIAQDTARAYGVEAVVEFRPRYDATANHAEPAQELRGRLADELGVSWQHTATSLPVMASEDFSYYLGAVPGAFALVGADDGDGHRAPLHNARYDFNDALISRVARLYARLAGAPLPG